MDRESIGNGLAGLVVGAVIGGAASLFVYDCYANKVDSVIDSALGRNGEAKQVEEHRKYKWPFVLVSAGIAGLSIGLVRLAADPEEGMSEEDATRYP